MNCKSTHFFPLTEYFNPKKYNNLTEKQIALPFVAWGVPV